jgi:FlaA1/EpsC-like NDP-sugar epimerase
MNGSDVIDRMIRKLGLLLQRLLPHLPHLRNRHFLLADIVTLCVVPPFALMLRTDNVSLFGAMLGPLAVYTACGLLIRLVVFYRFGLYRRCWRYATVDELVQTTVAVFAASVVLTGLFVLTGGFAIGNDDLPRSIPLIDFFLTLAAIGGSRFSARLARRLLRAPMSDADARRVLIVGAGSSGQAVAKELIANPQLQLKPVAFLDDDVSKQGAHILNLPVFGGRERLPEVARAQNVAVVVIAMPTEA